MQPEPHWQEQTLARFLHLSRLYLGLTPAPAAIRPPRRIAGSTRQMLRSLVVAGSLGALFGSPAFAGEEARPAETGKRSPSTHSPRTKADEQSPHDHRISIAARHR